METVLFFLLMGLATFCMYNVICIVLAKTEEEKEDYSLNYYLTNVRRLFNYYILCKELDDEDDWLHQENYNYIEDISKNRDGPNNKIN